MYEQKQIFLDGEFLGNSVVTNRYFELIYNISPTIIKNFINLVDEASFLSKPIRIKKYDFIQNNCIKIYFKSKLSSGEAQLSYALDKNNQFQMDTYLLLITNGENKGEFITNQNFDIVPKLEDEKRISTEEIQKEEDFIDIPEMIQNEIDAINLDEPEEICIEEDEKPGLEENINNEIKSALEEIIELKDKLEEKIESINSKKESGNDIFNSKIEALSARIEAINEKLEINKVLEELVALNNRIRNEFDDIPKKHENRANIGEDKIEQDKTEEKPLSQELDENDIKITDDVLENTENEKLIDKEPQIEAQEQDMEVEAEIELEEELETESTIPIEDETDNLDNIDNTNEFDSVDETESSNDIEQDMISEIEETNDIENSDETGNFEEFDSNEINNEELENSENDIRSAEEDINLEDVDSEEMPPETAFDDNMQTLETEESLLEIVNEISENETSKIFHDIAEEFMIYEKFNDYDLVDFFDTIPKFADEYFDGDSEKKIEEENSLGDCEENSIYKKFGKDYKLNRIEKIALYQNILKGYDNKLTEIKLNKLKDNFSMIQKEDSLSVEDILDAQVELLIDNESKAFRILGDDIKQDVIQIDKELFLSKDKIYTWGDVFLLDYKNQP